MLIKSKKKNAQSQGYQLEDVQRGNVTKDQLLREYQARMGEEHNLPVSRRDFLAAGMATPLVTAAIPSLISQVLFSHPAYAQDPKCEAPSSGGGRRNIVIGFDLSGGTNMIARIPNAGPGENIPAKLDKKAMTTNVGNINATPKTWHGMQYLNAVGSVQAGYYPAMRASLAAAQVPNTFVEGGYIQATRMEHRTLSDNAGGNQHCPMAGLVHPQSGLLGSVIKSAGSRSRAAGAKQNTFSAMPTPTRLQNADTLINAALGFAGDQNHIPQSKAEKVLKKLESLTSGQLSQLLNPEKQLAFLYHCGIKHTGNLKNSSLELDPRNIPIYQQCFKIDPTSAGNDRTVLAATAFRLQELGLIGPVNFEVGNRDNHVSSAARCITDDREDGEIVGKLIAAAYHLAGSIDTLVIYEIGDGNQQSDSGTPAFETRTDSARETGSHITYVSNANLAPSRFKKHLIGELNPQQEASINVPFPRFVVDHAFAGKAMAANILMALGGASRVKAVLGDFSSSAEMDYLIATHQIAGKV